MRGKPRKGVRKGRQAATDSRLPIETFSWRSTTAALAYRPPLLLFAPLQRGANRHLDWRGRSARAVSGSVESFPSNRAAAERRAASSKAGGSLGAGECAQRPLAAPPAEGNRCRPFSWRQLGWFVRDVAEHKLQERIDLLLGKPLWRGLEPGAMDPSDCVVLRIRRGRELIVASHISPLFLGQLLRFDE